MDIINLLIATLIYVGAVITRDINFFLMGIFFTLLLILIKLLNIKPKIALDIEIERKESPITEETMKNIKALSKLAHEKIYGSKPIMAINKKVYRDLKRSSTMKKHWADPKYKARMKRLAKQRSRNKKGQFKKSK